MCEEERSRQRAPGIVFVDGPSGCRAVVDGTGLDVWEIIATFRETGDDGEALRRRYAWLTEPQIHAALSYYEIYPQEIEARLQLEERWTPEKVRRELPFAQPQNQ